MTMSLRAHFLNVGNGDCTIIQMPDATTTVADVCNARSQIHEQSQDYVNPLRYIGSLSISSIYRYIQTHPDMDHMDGLLDISRAFGLANFWDTRNTRERPQEFGYGFREEDWDSYQELRRSERARFYTRNTNPILPQDNSERVYGIFVLGPNEDLVAKANKTEDWNMLSYVVLVRFGGFKLLLGGDASDYA